MKLNVTVSKDFKHSEAASSVGWSSANELYSLGDDHIIVKWNLKTNENSEVAKLPKDVYCTDIHWFPIIMGKKQSTSQSERFALACTDGRILLVSRSGRVENTIDGHKGAVLGVQWAHDGTALLSFGEDGAVKIWSKAGMLRSVLAQNAIPVYSATWSPDSDKILHTSGQTLIIKPLQPSTKPSQWKAHDNIILAVDWSQTVQLIISGGEDRKYKVWNSFGQLLYSSLLHDSPITSLSWSPAGDLFAVGGFNTLRLCDKAGWSHSLNKPQCGTIYKLAWSNDGTQMGGASGSGQIIMARVVERRMDWCHLEAVVTDENKITVRNSINDSKEYLVFSERIIKSSLSWDHLIVTTLTQCYIYSDPNWTTPLSFELKSGAVNLIKQSQRFFLLSEAFSGIQIASYEGRIVSTIKFPSDSVNQQTVAISNEIIIIRDNKEPNIIRFFDVSSGHEIGEPFKHVHEVEQVDISQSTVDRGSQKLLAFTDKNHDIFILDVKDKTRATGSVKIGSMVSSFAWNDSYNMLVGMADAQLMVWYLPSVVFTDQDLLPLTTVEIKGHFSKNPQILTFIGSHVTLRRSDGAIIMSRVSPFPNVVHEQILAGRWSNAVKTCRIAKDKRLWACLAGLALERQELGTAVTAYTAIDEVAKVQYMTYIKDIQSAELRNAELALFCHQPGAAEVSLVQCGMIFKAIEMYMQLFQWEKALDLAVRHKTHVDTVLAFRQKYIEDLGIDETSKRFQQYNEKITIDWEKVQAKLINEQTKLQ